mgnify:CR=1 FL=1|jgi:hypothetical protein
MDTPDAESNGLELVATKDMIQELQRRHDDFVLAAAQNKTEEFDDMTLCFGGSLHGIMGLITVAELAVKTGIGGRDVDEDAID